VTPRPGPPRAHPKAVAVRAYLDAVPPAMRAVFRELRAAARSAAPEAEEGIAYRMLALRDHGYLVYYGAWADHCSLFVASAVVRRQFAREIRPYRAGPGTLHSTLERRLPADLVRRLVQARVAENRARAERPSRRRPARSRQGARAVRASPVIRPAG
jgi:uncharacterized protein YdhG (YjbR/CyaY superfamily)